MVRVRAVILAAGAGRRMGGPKALVRARPGGPTFLETTVAAVRQADPASITVVTGARAEEVERLATSLGVEVVRAPDWEDGMSASLRAGLGALPRDEHNDVALVTLVDLPDVTGAVYRRAMDWSLAAADPGRLLARAAYRGRPGHPVLFGAAHWDAVAADAQGDAGARRYLTDHSPALIEAGDLATGRDADTPGDLDRG